MDPALQPNRNDRARVRSLLAWYRKAARDLPWRRTRDPYRIWISETMLQQTRVAAVIPYYERFLEALPDVRALARAPEERVLGLWSGLGYYGRARNLRRAAGMIVRRHGGVFPSEPQEIAELPGVGPYTQGALLSLAFDRPYPVVDGNVERVLARWFQVPHDPKGTVGKRVLWGLAASLLPKTKAATFNQALMELGARVCKPAAPLCEACPIAPACRARAGGNPLLYPVRPKRSRPLRVDCAAALVVSERGVLLWRRSNGENRGLLDLPMVEALGGAKASPAKTLRRKLEETGVAPGRLRELDSIRHAVMGKEYRVRLFHTKLAESHGAAGQNGGDRKAAVRWLPQSKWATAPLTARARKALGLLPLDGKGQARRPAGRKKSVRKSSVRRKPTRS